MVLLWHCAHLIFFFSPQRSQVALGPSLDGRPTTARSLFYLHPHFVWLPCEVLAWDADQQRFLVSFFSEAEMRASKDMQPALEELVQVRCRGNGRTGGFFLRLCY